MLSPHTTKLVDNLDSGRFLATEKLVPHLHQQIYNSVILRKILRTVI